MNNLKEKLKRHQLTQKIKWEIDDYKFLYDNTLNTEHIVSQAHPVFFNSDPEELLFEWYFQLLPKGYTGHENALSVYFNIASLELEQIPFVIVDATVSIKDEKGRVVASRVHNNKFIEDGGRIYNLLAKDYINWHDFNKKLVLEADLTFSFYKVLPSTEDYDSDSDTDNSLNIIIHNNQMSVDISVYLNNEVLSDVTISAGDQKYYGHKFILSARCPVFAAMFAHDFKENKENLVTVEESETVFYQILEYIYSNKFPTKETVSEELYAAAHKYGLEDFQNDCQTLLENSISMENVIKRLECAVLHDIDLLKKKAMNFIKKNFKDVIESQEWKKILTSNVDLVSEVLSFVHS